MQKREEADLDVVVKFAISHKIKLHISILKMLNY